MNIIIDLFKTLLLTPLLGTRPFLACLLLSLTASRFPAYLDTPTWFIQPNVIGLLGALAALEFIARHDPDIRLWFDQFDSWLKSGISLSISMSLVDPETASFLVATTGAAVESDGGFTVTSIFSGIWSTITAAITWYISLVRNSFMTFINEFDEDDDLGIQGFIHYIESFGVGFGVALVVFVPILALIGYLIVYALARRWQKRMEEKEQASRKPCSHCEAKLLPMALQCHVCGHKRDHVLQIGWLGQMTDKPVQDRQQHKHQLLTKKRCHTCATKLPLRSVCQTCPTCQAAPFEDRTDLHAYLSQLDKEMPQTLLISGLFSFIPVLGILPGLLYYRISLIASLRRYVPRTIGCRTRWGVRMLNLFILLFQPLPVIGWFAIPAMVYTNYHIYRRILVHQGKQKLPKSN